MANVALFILNKSKSQPCKHASDYRGHYLARVDLESRDDRCPQGCVMLRIDLFELLHSRVLLKIKEFHGEERILLKKNIIIYNRFSLDIYTRSSKMPLMNRPFWSSKMSDEQIQSCVIGTANETGTITFGCIANVFKKYQRAIKLRHVERGLLCIKNCGKINKLVFIPMVADSRHREPLETKTYCLHGMMEEGEWRRILSNIANLRTALNLNHKMMAEKDYRNPVDPGINQFLYIAFEEEDDLLAFTHHLGPKLRKREYEKTNPNFFKELVGDAIQCQACDEDDDYQVLNFYRGGLHLELNRSRF